MTARLSLWLQWLAATTVGAGVGFGIGLTARRLLDPLHDLAGFAFAATLAGLLVGSLQAALLRRRVADVGAWPLLTMAGALAATLFGYFSMRRMPAPIALTVGSAATGAVLAAVQSPALRRLARSPGAWMAGSGVALSLAAILFAAATRGAGMSTASAITVASAVYGAITGALMARWLPAVPPPRV